MQTHPRAWLPPSLAAASVSAASLAVLHDLELTGALMGVTLGAFLVITITCALLTRAPIPAVFPAIVAAAPWAAHLFFATEERATILAQGEGTEVELLLRGAAAAMEVRGAGLAVSGALLSGLAMGYAAAAWTERADDSRWPGVIGVLAGGAGVAAAMSTVPSWSAVLVLALAILGSVGGGLAITVAAAAVGRDRAASLGSASALFGAIAVGCFMGAAESLTRASATNISESDARLSILLSGLDATQTVRLLGIGLFVGFVFVAVLVAVIALQRHRPASAETRLGAALVACIALWIGVDAATTRSMYAPLTQRGKALGPAHVGLDPIMFAPHVSVARAPQLTLRGDDLRGGAVTTEIVDRETVETLFDAATLERDPPGILFDQNVTGAQLTTLTRVLNGRDFVLTALGHERVIPEARQRLAAQIARAPWARVALENFRGVPVRLSSAAVFSGRPAIIAAAGSHGQVRYHGDIFEAAEAFILFEPETTADVIVKALESEQLRRATRCHLVGEAFADVVARMRSAQRSGEPSAPEAVDRDALLGSLRVRRSEGPLSVEQIQAALAPRQSALRRCGGGENRPERVRFRISGEGVAGEVRVRASTFARDCFLEQLSQTRFPATGATTRASAVFEGPR